tara:strand:+ start:44 stop:478 length:435 start_codon:yes stop_codon:yes gene_type:complete
MSNATILEGIIDTAIKATYWTGQAIATASNIKPLEAKVPGSEYMGDFIHVGLFSYYADNISALIENYGKKKENQLIKKIGERFSETTIPLISAYFAIGETLVDWIPMNVMDHNDAYAAIAAGIIGTTYANMSKKNRKREEGLIS